MKTKGFTLIELAVVLLVIGILAGIVLKNIGSQGVQSRDTRRVADLRNTSVYLAQYLSKAGYFPVKTDLTWTVAGASLLQEMKDKGVVESLPQPPSGAEYEYYACTDDSDRTIANHYILRVALEETKDQNERIYDGVFDSSAVPSTWEGCVLMNGGDITNLAGPPIEKNVPCESTNKNYCVIQ